MAATHYNICSCINRICVALIQNIFTVCFAEESVGILLYKLACVLQSVICMRALCELVGKHVYTTVVSSIHSCQFIRNSLYDSRRMHVLKGKRLEGGGGVKLYVDLQ